MHVLISRYIPTSEIFKQLNNGETWRRYLCILEPRKRGLSCSLAGCCGCPLVSSPGWSLGPHSRQSVGVRHGRCLLNGTKFPDRNLKGLEVVLSRNWAVSQSRNCLNQAVWLFLGVGQTLWLSWARIQLSWLVYKHIQRDPEAYVFLLRFRT